MIDSYYQNLSVGMTKERYYEVCDALGTLPVDSEIPIEFDDLPYEVQTSILIFNSLQDNWDYMTGSYIGKNYTGVTELSDLYEVLEADRKIVFEFVRYLESLKRKANAEQIANREKRK